MPLPAIPNCCSTARFRLGTISLSCEVLGPSAEPRQVSAALGRFCSYLLTSSVDSSLGCRPEEAFHPPQGQSNPISQPPPLPPSQQPTIPSKQAAKCGFSRRYG